MPSPYDVLVVGSGPAGGTAARYAARRGLKVLLVDKRKEIGVPVQCGEYVAHNDEVRAIFPTVDGLDDLMEIPYRVREVDTPVIRRSEEHTSELQSLTNLVCRLLLEKKNMTQKTTPYALTA